MTKFYVVYGDPVPLARARYGKGRFYDSQKHLKLVWGINLSRMHGNDKMFKGPLFMDVTFYMPIPCVVAKYRRGITFNQWHYIKPDSSNLLKFIEDVATGICYEDDCIIAKQSVQKCYDDGKGARTEFMLSNLQERQSV